ncbi:sensor domain-containing phosphodiesterase [Xylophilus sp. ASV27]|uniref:sensor domain-containing phosphodiesterase n=1 Tax=Xylophilus sp. ASV27 TaxID=2795129 RepID=UPI0018EAC1AA|nr:sensor domain-containing phosphodiesterase [Xylophilus sp. ASV27]
MSAPPHAAGLHDSDIVDLLALGLFVCDAQGLYLRVNPSYEALTGYTAGELVGRATLAQVHDLQELMQRSGELPFTLSRDEEGKLLLRANPSAPDPGKAVGATLPRTWTCRRRSGAPIQVQLSLARLPTDGADTAHYLGVVTQEQGQHDSPHVNWHDGVQDAWTQLPNASWWHERAALKLQFARRRGTPCSVLVLEIDQMTRLRDSMGDDMLGQVLQLFGHRIRGTTGPETVLASLGGGLLACMLEGDVPEIDRLTGILLRRLSQPLQLVDRSLRLTASIGASICLPDRGRLEAGELLHRARVALGTAKAAGGAQSRWFRKAMQAEAIDRLELEGLLRQALEKKQFSLVFQPQVNLETGRIVLIETLLRWQCPGRGAVSPAVFIPVAEDIGLIPAIGEWVLRESCREVGRLRRLLTSRQAPVPQVAVNVSARQLLQPGLMALVESALQNAGMEPRHLEVEVTESALVGDAGSALATLESLRQLGVGLAIDDFGTGYSSFSYLTQFPFDRLKIDRSLVLDIDRPGKGSAIVSAILSLAHALDMRVTAEGVETGAQAAALKALGCDEVQGYWFSRPLTSKSLQQVLSAVAHPPA